MMRIAGNRQGMAHGFSLAELLTVLAISAIALGMGMPALRGLLDAQRVSSTANELLSAVNLTRSEAIRRAGRVDVVPLANGDWSSGWTVFVDANGNQRVDAEEEVILTHRLTHSGLRIDTNLPDGGRYLAYQGSGRTRSNTSAETPLFGRYTLVAGSAQRQVIINMLGRARICDPALRPQGC